MYSHGAPCVYEQAEQLGGVFTRINRGLPFRSVANFSPCLFEHEGHQLIAWRSQPEPFCFRHDMKYFYYNSTPTDVYIGELINDETIVGAKKIRDTPHRLSYEDPRLFHDGEGNLMCQFITSTYASRWDTTKHKMAKSPKVCVGTVPIVIKTPGEKEKRIDASALKPLTGDFPTFNSTAPIKIGDEWLVFYHFKFMGRVPKEQRPVLFYAMSCYTLDKDLTKIVRVLNEPMFQGSLEDELITWTDVQGNPVSKQPACILPFGATVNDDTLSMGLGINDSFMGIFRMGLNDLLALMDRV